MHLPLPASILLGEVEEVVDVVEEGVGSICSLIFSRVRTKVAYIIVLRQKSFTTALSIAHAKRHHPGMKERKLLKSLKTNPLSYYSCLKQPNRAAPASIQSLISSLILSCSSCAVQLLPDLIDLG